MSEQQQADETQHDAEGAELRDRLNQPVQPGQPTVDAQPGDNAQPVEPAQPAQPTPATDVTPPAEDAEQDARVVEGDDSEPEAELNPVESDSDPTDDDPEAGEPQNLPESSFQADESDTKSLPHDGGANAEEAQA